MVLVKIGKLQRRVKLAMDWLTDIAMKKEEQIINEFNVFKAEQLYWKGAIRNEYNVAKKQWIFYAPIWHSGQAIKALLKGAQLDFIEDKDKYINAAKEIASFIIKNQIWDESNPDHGLILAFEDLPGLITTSGIFEASHGLLLLSKLTGDDIYKNRVLKALEFCADKLYRNEKGLFNDAYNPTRHKIVNPYQVSSEDEVGRPLNDDSMFLRAYKLTNNEKFKKIFWEIINKLVWDENPFGNWINYFPCNKKKDYIHPRHAFWWGRPFIKAYEETQNEEYLLVAKRAGNWYKKAIRRDGGLFRNTYSDFNTDSFGHATSGAASAVILWLDLQKTANTIEYDSLIKTCLNYCMKLQFTKPQDKNLLGCVLEKVLMPDGTDRNPFFIRDLGTIFFIQAAVKYLKQE